uniref:Thioredoxin domain-containing protein n=1 Tax=Heterosigma akashiwo TaxID=2829 RepID=A0A7S3XXZ8_HETAK
MGIASNILFLIFASFIASSICAPARRGPVTADSKRAQLFNLAKAQSDYVVELNDGNFDFYAAESPRPYHIVAFFTATHKRYGCNMCKSSLDAFKEAAASYKATLGDTMRGDEIFFIAVDIDSAKNTFQRFQFKTVPQVFVIPPSTAGLPAYTADPSASFLPDAHPEAEKFARFVERQLGVKFQIVRSNTRALMTLFALLGAMVAAVRPILNRIDFFLRLVRKKAIWMVVCLGLYTTSISGMIYDIIRNPPPYYMNHQTGQINFFHPQSNQQFVAEGFIIGFLNVGAAIALILMVTQMKRFKDPQNKSTFVGICYAVFVILLYTIISLYRVKNRWYMRV